MIEIDNIYNVNCYDAIKSIPDKSIDCIYTDIPYFIKNSKKSRKERNAIRTYGNIDKKMNEINKYSLFEGIDYGIINEFIRISKKVNCFIWCNIHQIFPIMKIFNENNLVGGRIYY